MDDLTDAFDVRLAALDAARRTAERDAAILVYERLKTAGTIARAIWTQPATAGELVALASELGRVEASVQAGHGSRSIE